MWIGCRILWTVHWWIALLFTGSNNQLKILILQFIYLLIWFMICIVLILILFSNKWKIHCVIVHVYCKMIEFQSSALIWDRTLQEYLAFFVQTLQIHTLLHMYQRNIHWFDDRFLRECVYSKGRGTQFLSTIDEISIFVQKLTGIFCCLN